MSPVLAAVVSSLVSLLVPAIPGLIHLVFSPSPTSWWGGKIDRLRKAGFDPAVFEPEAVRLAKAEAETVAKLAAKAGQA